MAPPGMAADADADALSSAPSSSWAPARPNILLTGTPGVGKTTLGRSLASELGLRHVEVGSFARERGLLGEEDPDARREGTRFMDEDGVLDELEPVVAAGAAVVEHHSCDWFPERWFQLVVVLRAGTEALYDRLTARGYGAAKVAENVQAEIMQVVLEEAVAAYPRVSVVELRNETEGDRERNLATVRRAWRELTSQGVDVGGAGGELVDGQRV